MRLDYDNVADTIRIHDTALGGRDIGSAYDAAHSGLVEIDFTYTNNLDDHRLTLKGHMPPFGIGVAFEGWGWLNHHDPDQHIYSSDRLFIGQRIPEPATLALFGLGLAGLGVMRRRKTG